MTRISDQIRHCEEEAALAKVKALISTGDLSLAYLRLERDWMTLRDSLEFAKTIDGFLQWAAQRVDVPHSRY